MQDLNKQLQALSAKIGLKGKQEATAMTEMYTDYEINLVPEVKSRMLKAMRFRNLILFICIIVVAVAGSAVSILGSVTGGQAMTLASQDSRLDAMSKKLQGWEGLEELLSVQNQLKGIQEANDGKFVLSRIFPVLAAILPDGPDKVWLSELNIDVAGATLSFDGQADAKVSPFIDYRVLESFKKGVALMHYDYGRYVDEDGNEIPTRCIIESDDNGFTFSERKKSDKTSSEQTSASQKDTYIYAYWNRGARDCDPNRDDSDEAEEEEEDEEEEKGGSGQSSSLKDFMELFGGGGDTSGKTKEQLKEEAEEERRQQYDEFMQAFAEKYDDDGKDKNKEYIDVDFVRSLYQKQFDDGVKVSNMGVEKIYRTPNFEKWYEEGNIDEAGEVSNVPHFVSQCITYSGQETNGKIYWTQTNDCMLAEDGVDVTSSANGKDASGSLVLAFTATIKLDDAVLSFKNKHMMAISPEGKNVTDSYTQIEGMFVERAAACTDGDVVCTSSNAKKNTGEQE